MRHALLLGIAFGCIAAVRANHAAAQNDSALASYIRENAIPVQTIDPAGENFDDLEPLIASIGDARVVALGEQSHGDGAAFLAKHRLIRFLHQRMGFDVLVWESGMFDCREMDRALQDGAWGSEVVPLGIFPIWSESGHVVPVLDYAESTQGSDRPLEMAGFDCQFSSNASAEAFPRFLQAFFDALDSTRLSDERVTQLKRVVESERCQPS